MPPITVATKATSSGAAPMVGVTEAVRPTQNSATTPASRPLMAKAAEMTRLAGTPSRRVMRKLSEAARRAMPSTVRRSSRISRPSRTRLVAMASRLRMGRSWPSTRALMLNSFGRGTPFARGEMMSSAAFCSRVLTAKEVISMAVGECSRTGRKATRSVR